MAAIEKTGDGSGNPAVEWFAIIPSDTAYLPARPRALYVDVTGTLRIESLNGAIMNYAAVAVGYHPVRPVKVHATGTTAIVYGLY